MTLDAKPVTDIAVQFDAAHTLVGDDLAARLKVELVMALRCGCFSRARLMSCSVFAPRC